MESRAVNKMDSEGKILVIIFNEKITQDIKNVIAFNGNCNAAA